jgi:hypothetical protein
MNNDKIRCSARRVSRAALGAVTLAAAVLAGCGLVYTDIRSPHAYRTATPSEVKTSPEDPVVEGQACDKAVLFLVAWGNSGYLAATQDALKDHPSGILYDVKTDMHATVLAFGAYTRVCTLVRGRVGHI